jgi:hypothetical protein
MGEKQNRPIQLFFNALLKIGFQGSRVTSGGGLLLVRELDERLGFSELIAQNLTDSRGKNAQPGFADLLRQSVYSRLAGYEDLNDAERPSKDPTFRRIGSEKIWDRGAALTSRLQNFETEKLAEDANFPRWRASAGHAMVSGVGTNVKICRSDETGSILVGCRESKIKIPVCGKWEERKK